MALADSQCESALADNSIVKVSFLSEDIFGVHEKLCFEEIGGRSYPVLCPSGHLKLRHNIYVYSQSLGRNILRTV